MNTRQQSGLISVIVTAHNEGDEVARTLESIRASTPGPYEIVLVDDASTDGACLGLNGDDLCVIRHEERIGIAYSRNEGCASARGDVFAFLDAHQRLSHGCLRECAEVAVEHQAIVWPEVRGLQDRGWTGHGAFMRLCAKRGYFTGKWNRRAPRDKLSRISTMIVPGYVIPRTVFGNVRWIEALRGWGASESAVALKAFFQDIDILHLCGPLARHFFRPAGKIPYSAGWKSVWRNHALVARVCFDRRTWFDHWLPEVFDKHLTGSVKAELESPEVLAEHEAFQERKARPDREFWQGLLRTEEPRCLRP